MPDKVCTGCPTSAKSAPKILLRSCAPNAWLKALPIGKNLTDHPTGFVFNAKLWNRVNLKSFFERAHHHASRYRRRWGFILNADHLAVGTEPRRLSAPRLHHAQSRGLQRPQDPPGGAMGGKRLALWDLLQLAKYWDLLIEALNCRFGPFTSVRHVSGFVFAEQLSGHDNAIELREDERYAVKWEISQWEISQQDAASLDSFLVAFVERHRDLFEAVRFFPGLLGSGAHHSGGCRMASTAEEGVVDHRLRVFGVDNLFVADGSVLAYSGHANTGLTIAAFALKCADEVLIELKRSSRTPIA